MNLIAVFVGGIVGTALRLGLDALLPPGDDGVPWSTLIVNVTGSFALGFLVSRFWRTAPEWLRYGLGTGVLGSFTTFSALIGSYVLLTYVNGDPVTGGVYLVVTILAGCVAAALGLGLGLGRGRRDAPVPPIGPDE